MNLSSNQSHPHHCSTDTLKWDSIPKLESLDSLLIPRRECIKDSVHRHSFSARKCCVAMQSPKANKHQEGDACNFTSSTRLSCFKISELLKLSSKSPRSREFFTSSSRCSWWHSGHRTFLRGRSRRHSASASLASLEGFRESAFTMLQSPLNKSLRIRARLASHTSFSIK